MSNFRSNNSSRDRRGFGDRDSRRPQLYEAVCAECGKTCQVPFRPTGEKPVYCSECFEKRGGRDAGRSGGRRSYDDRSSRRFSSGDSGNQAISKLTEEIGGLNAKLDKIIELLSPTKEEPTKPVEKKVKKDTKTTSTKKKATSKTEA